MRTYLYFILLVFTGTSITVNAQQIPLFNFSIYQPELTNPARIGEGFIGIDYRRQWLDLEKGDAPISYFLVFDPSNLLKLNEKKIGIGLSLLADETHLIKRNEISGAFSYHLLKTIDHHLSASVRASFLTQNLNIGDGRLNDPFDLALFSEGQQSSVFNGGFGLYYGFFPSDQHQFNIDFILPQLFSSDLVYEKGGLTDIVPHLAIRGSYRFSNDRFGFEPILGYRDLVGDQKLKAGNLDIGLKLYFLNNQIWVGGGLRFDTETYNVAFSVVPDKSLKLQIMGSYELNSVFGNGIEVGLKYDLGSFKETGPSNKINLNHLLLTAKQVEKERSTILDKLNNFISTANKSLNGLTTGQVDEFAKKERLENAKQKLDQAQKEFTIFADRKRQVNDAKRQADELTPPEAQNKRSYRRIDFINSTLNAEFVGISEDISRLRARIANLDKLLNPKIDDLVRSRELTRIKAFYQTALDRLSLKPSNLKPVKVIGDHDGNSINVEFSYPNGLDIYNLDQPALSDVRSLVNFIELQIQDLQRNDIEIESIQLKANLRDDPSFWQFNAANYLGEFITIQYTKTNNASSENKPETLTINTGSINLEKLAALKLFYIRDFLITKGISNSFIVMNINGPNKQQELQTFDIGFTIKP